MMVAIYSTDVEYNCLPSLHVAQCFLAAFACHKVHRGVGRVAFAWANLVALSTLFIKQHYVLDVITGALLGWLAYAIFMRSFPAASVPANERRLAPTLAIGAASVYGVAICGFAVAYLLR